MFQLVVLVTEIKKGKWKQIKRINPKNTSLRTSKEVRRSSPRFFNFFWKTNILRSQVLRNVKKKIIFSKENQNNHPKKMSWLRFIIYWWMPTLVSFFFFFFCNDDLHFWQFAKLQTQSEVFCAQKISQSDFFFWR